MIFDLLQLPSILVICPIIQYSNKVDITMHVNILIVWNLILYTNKPHPFLVRCYICASPMTDIAVAYVLPLLTPS